MMDEYETITCQYCDKVLCRGRWLGSMERILETHQQSRECLLVQSEILRELTEKSKQKLAR